MTYRSATVTIPWGARWARDFTPSWWVITEGKVKHEFSNTSPWGNIMNPPCTMELLACYRSKEIPPNSQTCSQVLYFTQHFKSPRFVCYEKQINEYIQFSNIQVKENSVFNVALNVKNIDVILDNCKKNNVSILQQKTKIIDRSCSLRTDSHINYAVISSCIDGVSHTIIDKSGYSGRFLPTFEYLPSTSISKSSPTNPMATHFDHLTYATYRNTSNYIMNWYKNIFNMERYQLNK
jgi:hypothetical protein